MALVDTAGTVKADYTYDPYGRIVLQSGDYAEANPFRFSSEFHDDETSLVYYINRYYDPSSGKWLSRDPIQEQGGLNIYGFVGNNPVNSTDEFGLWSRDEWKGKRGDYTGTACKDGEDDTTKKLAEYITGDSGDSYSAIKIKGDTYDVSRLLEKLERKIRLNVVYATARMGIGFARSNYYDGGEEWINEYYSGKSKIFTNTDCRGGAMLAMAKGLINTLKKGEFDALGYSLRYFNRGGQLMEPNYTPTPNSMLLGDWGYIQGYQNYNSNKGHYAGENIIKVGSSLFWVNGEGVHDLLYYERRLTDKRNFPSDQDWTRRGAYRGFLPNQTVFIKVAQVGMDIFDLRKKSD